MRDAEVSEALLAWYDRAARVMPWRVGPAARAAGVRPDAYRVWLSEVMLQQTTVAAVTGYFTRFVARWPTVQDLAAAAVAELQGGISFVPKIKDQTAVFEGLDSSAVIPATVEI